MTTPDLMPQKQSSKLKKEEDFDFKKLISKLINNLPLFIICVIIFIGIGYMYKKYSVSKYKISAMMIVEDDKGQSSSGGAMGGLGSLTDISSLLGVTSNAENEVNILKSRSIIDNVVKDLKLNIIVFQKSRFRNIEIFNEAPFDVNISYKTDSVEAKQFDVTVKNNIIYLKNSKDDIDIKANFGEKISLPQYDLVFEKRNMPISQSGYNVMIVSEEASVESLSKYLDASLSSKTTTTINLSLDYDNSKKGEAILNKVMDLYLRANRNNKLQIADSTLRFINDRLKLVGRELTDVESEFEGFRKQNKIADVDEQSKALVGASSDFLKQLSALDVQISVIQDLQKYLNNPNNKKIIPASLSVTGDGLSETIGKYNELLLERDRRSLVGTDSNPYIKNLDMQIESFRNIILNNLSAFLKGLLVSKNNLKEQNAKFNGQIESVPAISRRFLDYTRQQTVKQDLYIFLLQKREETAISRTSTISTARIVDSAKSEYQPNYSRSKLIMLAIFSLGIILPLAYLYLRELLNVRINYKSDIEELSDIPVVGEISHNESENSLVVNNQARSIISEQFRALRTNLQYLLKTDKPQVILVSSSMSGEGKSFVSLNMGSVLALGDKKVVFIELDLRKPKLSQNIGLDNSNGFTNFIVSSNMEVDNILKPLWFSENCFLISSGPIPPNPSELLLHDRLRILIEKLKETFDFIVIDSAPVGLVSDALIVEKFVDITLYIVRQKYTFKAQLDIINDLVQTKKLKKAYLIVNDIEEKTGSYYSGYGYGYGYGYSQYGDYAEASKKKSIWAKILGK